MKITAIETLRLGEFPNLLWVQVHTDAGLTGLGKFIGGSGALGAFVYGFANRMLIPVGLHHILNSFVWFIYGDYETPNGTVTDGRKSIGCKERTFRDSTPRLTIVSFDSRPG